MNIGAFSYNFNMKKLLTLSLSAALCQTLFGAVNAHAWGQYGHEQINDAAITLLENSGGLWGCLDSNRYVMRRMAIVPDVEWKSDMQLANLSEGDKSKRFDNNKYEHPLHFDEVDAWVPHPRDGEIAKLPNGEFKDSISFFREKLSDNAAYILEVDPLKKLKDPSHPTVNEVTDHGTAPWRALQLYRLGVEALRARDSKLAMLYLGTLGHYIGDMAQPFHTSLNFDGGYYPVPAAGIHHEIDTGVLPQKGKDQNDVYPNFQSTQAEVLAAARRALEGKIQPLAESAIVSEIFKLVETGYKDVAVFLKSYSEECAAAQNGNTASRHSRHRSRHVATDSPYCVSTPATTPHGHAQTHAIPAASERHFAGEVRSEVMDRLGRASTLLARIWLSAFEAAEKPQLAECSSISFDQSYAIQNYPRPSQDGKHGYLPQDYVPGRHN